MSVEGILEAFAMESAELLEGIEEAAKDLEAGRAGALDQLFRLVHTLKGSAGIVGLNHVSAFCHAWESRLHLLREAGASLSGQPRPRGDPLVPALLACRDRLAASLASSTPQVCEDGRDAGAESLTAVETAVLAGLDEAIAHALGGLAAAEGEDRAAPPSGQAPAREAKRPGEGYARVAAAKLERILSLSSDLAISLSNLFQSARRAGDQGLLDEISALEGKASTLYRTVLDTRMVPFADVAERYRRSVEEIAQATGRQMLFVLEGGETEIEKGLADRVAEPLLHLVRNAADHGIEPPDRRRAAGKTEAGTVTLRARRDASLLTITVEDDGGGIDPEAVRRRAVEVGLLAPDAHRSADELMDYLFEPGFSLSSSVTRWSGRGVGLDVVKRGVENLRGSIRIQSIPGRGSRIVVRLPVSLSLVEGFVAWAAGLQLLVPFESAWSCVEIPSGPAASAFGTLMLGQDLVPAIDLGILYGEGGGVRAGAGDGMVAPRFAIRIDDLGRPTAIAVDGVGETVSAAVRPLDRSLAQAPGIAGYAIRGDGTIMLVLDVAELARLAAREGGAPRT